MAADSYHHGNLRQSLLDHAVELARSGGPDAVVLRDVQRLAGVSNSAAYRHYSDRGALLAAVTEYAVVASLGGAPKHPVWYFNIKANPRVELQDGTETRDYEAREVVGDEKAIWWERSAAVYPSYDEYQAATTRVIPVLVARRADA